MTFQILKRKFLDIEPTPSKVGLKGEYKLIVRRQDGSVARETPWFDNLILDAGLNRWGTAAVDGGAAIGTGTSTPTSGQTALDAQTTYTTTTASGGGTGAQGSAPYYTTRTFVYRTTIGALNGNYSEVGFGWASGAMFSRALIVDGVGSPTTISVSSTEQLDIIYRLRIYPPSVDTSTSKTIGGVSYTITGRAAFVTNSATYWTGSTSVVAPVALQTSVASGAIGAITTGPSGTSSSCGSATGAAYSNNSYTRSLAATFGLTNGNVSGGARSFQAAWSFGVFQYDFGASIPKDSTKTLVLNSSVSWAVHP